MVEAPFAVEPYLEVLLQVADSAITYRTRYLTALRTEYVLELLLADEANPRSIAFQVASLLDHTSNLPHRVAGDDIPVEQDVAQKLLNALRETDMDDLATRDGDGDLKALEDLLKRVKTDLYDISDNLTARYLSHLTSSRLASS
jgi:uncharacterized alpha-E superfamily protein